MNNFANVIHKNQYLFLKLYIVLICIIIKLLLLLKLFFTIILKIIIIITCNTSVVSVKFLISQNPYMAHFFFPGSIGSTSPFVKKKINLLFKFLLYTFFFFLISKKELEKLKKNNFFIFYNLLNREICSLTQFSL